MSHKKNILRTAFAVFSMVSMLLISNFQTTTVSAASGYEFVVLNSYSKTLSIGDEFYLLAITTNGKKPSYSSSNSSVASVNTYGKITAKKAGTATIKAKIKNGEASCKINVNKTVIELSKTKLFLENGEQIKLNAVVSTGHPAAFKSSKSSIASVDENGMITAKKPGTATITVTANKTKTTCSVTVKKPSVKLNKSSVSLYRKGHVKLSVTSTSKSKPKWKSNKKSVAVVNENGTVTAVKNGTALITVTIDGISKTCEITVKKPTIKFDKENVTLQVNETYQTKVSVSSKNKPAYSSSNTRIAFVDENGMIHAKAIGKAYIYAKEDGAKERMTVIVK